MKRITWEEFYESDSESHFSNYWKVSDEFVNEMKIHHKIGAESAFHANEKYIDELEARLKEAECLLDGIQKYYKTFIGCKYSIPPSDEPCDQVDCCIYPEDEIYKQIKKYFTRGEK